MNTEQKIIDWFVKLIGKIEWKPKPYIDKEQTTRIRELLSEDYYVILTRKNHHLSTYATNLGHFFLTGRWGFWGHALMNLEDEVSTKKDFRLIEAIAEGVTYSNFDEVFKVHHAVLMIPRGITLEEWTAALDFVRTTLGTPYDTLFDISKANRINCVELVYLALNTLPNAHQRFPIFFDLVKNKKKITPDMFIECEEFIVRYKV